jgi:hypothetical protein
MPKDIELENVVEDLEDDIEEEDFDDESLRDDEDFEDEDEDAEENDDEDLDESVASETLKPMGGSGGGETRAERLATFTSLLTQLDGPSLEWLFTKTQEQFGPSKFTGSGGSEDSNKNTIKAKSTIAKGGDMGKMPMPKLGVKEDVEEMLGNEDLSESFKEKAETIFEAALNTRLNLELVKLSEEIEVFKEELEEEYAEKLEESFNMVFEDIVEKTDQYLDYVIEQWMSENEIAIETSLRTEISESFIDALKGVFAEHYIEIPEERFDVVSDLKNQLDEVTEKLTNVINENIELRAESTTVAVDSILNTVSEDLTNTQKERLRALSEGIEFTDPDTYINKLMIVKENYFKNKKSSGTGLITETIDGEDTSSDLVSSSETRPDMLKYTRAISKSVK